MTASSAKPICPRSLIARSLNALETFGLVRFTDVRPLSITDMEAANA